MLDELSIDFDRQSELAQIYEMSKKTQKGEGVASLNPGTCTK